MTRQFIVDPKAPDMFKYLHEPLFRAELDNMIETDVHSDPSLPSLKAPNYHEVDRRGYIDDVPRHKYKRTASFDSSTVYPASECNCIDDPPAILDLLRLSGTLNVRF